MTGRTVIYNARMIDPASGRDEKGGVLIENGVIADIGPSIAKTTTGDLKIDAKGKAHPPGLIDLRVKTGEPGAENKETLETASDAAGAGGVTTFVVMPDTEPVIDHDDLGVRLMLSHRFDAWTQIVRVPARDDDGESHTIEFK